MYLSKQCNQVVGICRHVFAQVVSHLADDIKSVKLTQEFHEGSLDLPICTRALAKPSASDGINLIHKDDAGLVLFGIAKHLSDEASTLSNVLVDNGT